jgi:hypothetical protein
MVVQLRQAVRRWVGELRLRWRLRRELAALEIEEPTTMSDVCGRLSKRRGKPIRLVPYPFDVPGPFGMWLPTTSTDYILFQAETTALHQEHIIAHELGHLIAGHESVENEDQVWHELMPDIPPETIRRVLRRGTYDTDAEREAETVATMLLESAAAGELVALPAHSARARRAQRALSDRRRWL